MFWLLLLIPSIFVYSYWRDRRVNGPAVARRQLLIQSLVVLGLYCLGLVALVLLEDKLVYQPVSYDAVRMENPGLVYEPVQLPCSTGETLEAWWSPQEKATCTILFCHGTGGNLSIHCQLVPMLQHATPVNVLTFAYPGYSKSTGTPSEANCYASAEAAYRWLTVEKGIKPNRLLILGQSLGGGVACELGAKQTHAGLILLSAFTSLPERAQELLPIFPVRWLMKNQFNNLARLQQYQGPLLIAHGDHDEVVPHHHGEALFAGAASTSKRFCLMPGGTHVMVTQSFFREVADMIKATDARATDAAER
jgi:fermentation-respiration switch protein FrsA (DUF1100 family)